MTSSNFDYMVPLTGCPFFLGKFIGQSHGICAISGYLSEFFPGTDIRIFDQQLSNPTEIINYIILEKPALIGVSVKLQTFDKLLALINTVNLNIPVENKPLFVIGNSIPHFNGQYILEKYFMKTDVIIGIGEGEIVLGDLVRYIQGDLSLKKVRNIGYWQNNQIHISKQEFLEGKYIVCPDRSQTIDFYDLGGEIFIESSRGCGYCGCAFCACKEFLGSKKSVQKWRPRPIDIIVKDILILQELGVNYVTFADEDFFGPDVIGIERAQRLAHEFIDNGIKVKFRIHARVKSIFNKEDSSEIKKSKEETINLLKQAGLIKIFLGFESGAKTQLLRYRKGFLLEEFSKAVSVLQNENMDYELGYILLDPLVTLAELKESLNFLKTKRLINKISAVFKELRVLVGSDYYINKVREIEKGTGKTILGDFDFNYQEYMVNSYFDENVNFLVQRLRESVNIGYKLYYALRILTRYSDTNRGKEIDNLSTTNFFLETINNLRQIEFSFIYDMVLVIENNGRNIKLVKNLLLDYEKSREVIVNDLLFFIESSLEKSNYKMLRNEIDTYYSIINELFLKLTN